MLPKSLTKTPIPMAMRPPPPLVQDAMREIFLRLPPDDPRGIVRAAAGCRSWRGIVSDAAFARDYRELHGAPPMLGFFYEGPCNPVISHFVSTATFRPPACQDRRHCHLLDSRHGLVLFHTPRMTAEFLVCDVVTGNQRKIYSDTKCADIMWCWMMQEEEKLQCNAVVLCADDRCDHLDCRGGPFRIALVGSVKDGSVARATVYSSETREWSDMIEVQTSDYIDGTTGHSAVVGNKVYVPCVGSGNVIEYNLDEQKLSVIHAPDTNHPKHIYLIGVEDGMLLFASVKKSGLFLWSMDVGPSGAVGWARHRIIDLKVFSDSWDGDMSAFDFPVGFAEGVSVIFLSTHDGLYTIDLNSGESKKVHQRRWIEKVMPYMSFYTGAWERLPISH